MNLITKDGVDTSDPAMQTKQNLMTKHPIYRVIAKNKTDMTLNQMHDVYKMGYKQIGWSSNCKIKYHIDDDHDILCGIEKASGPISARDSQLMRVRFRIMNHKMLNGIHYDIVSIMLDDTSKSNVLYIKPPQKAIRTNYESECHLYYKKTDAKDNEFMIVIIKNTVQGGGWMPNWVEDRAFSHGMKDEMSAVH